MRKVCESCRTSFEAKRAAAKYCGDRCRKRAQRKPQPQRDGAAVAAPVEQTSGPAGAAHLAGTAERTAAELERAGRLDTAVGRAALVLALRIDGSSAETGAALAALVREHRAALADALKDAQPAADPLDELRARRERKLGG